MNATNKTPDNTPAFPSSNDVEVQTAQGVVGTKGHPGMTLRDYFAGQIATGMITAVVANRLSLLGVFSSTDADIKAMKACVAFSYHLADAMIDVRGKSDSP